jgi:hypothetical protein
MGSIDNEIIECVTNHLSAFTVVILEKNGAKVDISIF